MLASLLRQAQAIRPEIYRVSIDGWAFEDAEGYAYSATAPGGQFWTGDTPEELLRGIRDNAISEAA